jgi:hypothetical protein
MKVRYQYSWHGVFALVAILCARCVSAGAQTMRLDATGSIAEGVHLWYEIKADPEEPRNLILCGTKWDAVTNGPYGFVYASSDSGSTWQAVLEDRNSVWVTEHSCAFGLKHRAYFVSEASKVFDGEQHHNLGITRLFVSADAGQHWIETCKTGWADFSASAVSPTTGRLYTFFNDPSTIDPGRNRGNSIGLLVFSPDGKQVEGSFSLAEMRDRNYQGVYPNNAIALNSGEIAVSYYGARQTSAGLEGELGFVRADTSSQPSLERTVISRGVWGKECLHFDNNDLAYDRERNRLFALYVEGCKTTRMMLTSSDDEGRTWAKSIVIAEQEEGRMVMDPSLVASPGGVLGLLWSEWKEVSRRWLFAQIQDKRFVEAPIELSREAETLQVSNDSLWSTIHRPKGPQKESTGTSSGPSITVDVRGLVDVVWRSSGLIAMGDRFLAIWPSRGTEGMRLNSGILTGVGSASIAKTPLGLKQPLNPDVTRYSLITYGGSQSFDKATGTLTVCLALTNRGNESMRVPIKLEATDIQSPAGAVTILNATNGLGGVGAIWDISDSVSGDRLAPDTTTNPFCLSAHVGGFSRHALPWDENLLTLKMRVLSPVRNSLERETEP